MKTSVYVRNKNLSPSGYYRVLQYVNKLQGDFLIHSIISDGLFEYSLKIKKNQIYNKLWSIFYYMIILLKTLQAIRNDTQSGVKCIIISKLLIPRVCPLFIIKYMEKKFRNKTIIWDFDDDIIGNSMSLNEFNFLAKYSKYIVVTHEYLTKKIPNKYKNKIVIMATTDGDMQIFEKKQTINKRLSKYDNEVNILWLGTATNLINLNLVIDKLEIATQRISKTGKKIVLKIVCNIPLNYATEYLQIENIKWSRECAFKEVQESHIGIMPLIDNEFNKSKGSFKLIQYMSTAMPVIASNIGFNQKVVDESFGFLIDDIMNPNLWIEAVIILSTDKKKWLTYSNNAYKEWCNNYSFDDNLNKWREILCETESANTAQ